MSIVEDRTTKVPRKKLKKQNPIEAAIAEIQAFIVNSMPALKPMVPIESKSLTESQPADILREIRMYESDDAKRSTFNVKKKVKKLSRMVTPGFGYDVTSSIRVTHPIIAKALYYKKVTKKKLKKSTKSALRQGETSTTTDDETEDTSKFKDITRGRTSKFGPKLTLMYIQQALYTAEPYGQGKWTRSNIHLVKNNEKAQKFTMNVFSQNVGVFKAIKSKISNTKIRAKIDTMTKIYRDKFADFVESNQNQRIATSLGIQKVVLNTIETSNLIMRRLFNLFMDHMKDVFIPDRNGLIENWCNRIDNEEKQEYAQACQNMKICRSKYTFSSFLVEFIAILVQVDNVKLKQAIDAITEVVKNIKLDKLMDKYMQTELYAYIDAAEKAEEAQIRTLLAMARNMLVNKNKPLVVRQSVLKRVVDQNIMLMDLIDLLDGKILATDENVSKWNDLKNSLTQWANILGNSDGLGNNILEIMQAFVNIFVEGIKNMNKNMARKFHHKFQMFLRLT
ncbi:hypothetical protein O0L34_g15845 [Tuta absoluta]|nr:hypothetical protein O0L34_g15845 [Tuta absoluta]